MTTEYNDLAFEEKQKEEVMMYIQAKGDNAFVAPDIPIAQDNGNSLSYLCFLPRGSLLLLQATAVTLPTRSTSFSSPVCF